jgi:hypothetical protein
LRQLVDEVYSSRVPGLFLVITGTPAFVPWDVRLAAAMRERGVSVPEESVAAALLDVLQGWSG